MKIGDKEVEEIIIKTADGGLIASITDEKTMHSGGYEIIFKEKK